MGESGGVSRAGGLARQPACLKRAAERGIGLACPCRCSGENMHTGYAGLSINTGGTPIDSSFDLHTHADNRGKYTLKAKPHGGLAIYRS